MNRHWAENITDIGILLVAGLAATVLLVASVHARDLDGRYANSPKHDWFEHLESVKGRCCADADGQVVIDADWESKDGHYRVFIENQWWDVPDDAVLKEPNLDGRTIVWPIYYRNLGKLDRIEIRCFIVGPAS